MVGTVQLEPGSTFATDFRIERSLSAGGMGAGYLVKHLKTDRLRALKLMHAELATNADLRRRFEQEARVGANIRSEHVVEVIDTGVDDDSGLPWLAMEYLEGADLLSTIEQRGALAPDEVGQMFAQMCHALEAAHSVGVVHRDLKPENVFLAVSQREGLPFPFTVKVLDFGIAKVVQEAQRTDRTVQVGSPLWMAPEQSMADGTITPGTDIWALGLLAFFLLTGRSYWRSGNQDASPVMILREVTMDPIVPSSQRAAELGVAQLLPTDFDGWFARCVARDAAERFTTVSELRDALLPLLGDANKLSRTANQLPVPTEPQGPAVAVGASPAGGGLAATAFASPALADAVAAADAGLARGAPGASTQVGPANQLVAAQRASGGFPEVPDQRMSPVPPTTGNTHPSGAMPAVGDQRISSGGVPPPPAPSRSGGSWFEENKLLVGAVSLAALLGIGVTALIGGEEPDEPEPTVASSSGGTAGNATAAPAGKQAPEDDSAPLISEDEPTELEFEEPPPFVDPTPSAQRTAKRAGPTGTLILQSTGDYCRFKINGIPQPGKRVRVRIPVGTHRVACLREGGQKTASVKVRKSKTLTVTFQRK
jgi:tRNA A-37 threonylcarbamoyl transferase component Bud32